MTEDLKPGRELDKLIAEKVMGIKLLQRIDDVYVVKEDGIYTIDPEPYSTEISAAWEVITKCSELDEYFHFEITNNSVGEKQWTAHLEIHDLKLPSYDIIVKSDTAPHAICLAALKAVGHI